MHCHRKCGIFNPLKINSMVWSNGIAVGCYRRLLFLCLSRVLIRTLRRKYKFYSARINFHMFSTHNLNFSSPQTVYLEMLKRKKFPIF